MPQLLVNVNQTTVKYNSFNIIMNASFNGIQGDITSAQIKTVIPNYIQYTLPPITAPIQSIDENPVANGTELVFNIGAITDLGQALVLIFGANFKPGTPDGTTYSAEYDLYINNQATPIVTTQSPVVTLSIKGIWVLEKSLVIPSSGHPAPGGTAVYLIQLKNIGDAGAPISNVSITDTLPTGMSFDVNYTPIGVDYSGLDNTANTNGVVSGNTVTFTINSYKGTLYYMIYQVVISNTVTAGTQLTNTADWSINNVSQTPISYTATVEMLQPYASIGKYGPVYASPGDKISYELYLSNPNNAPLTNVVAIDTIPPEVTITKIFPGSFYIPLLNIFPNLTYVVDYEVDNSGIFINPQTFPFNLANAYSYIDFSSVSGKVTKIRWTFADIPMGLTNYYPPRLYGVIDPNTTSVDTTNNLTVFFNATSYPVSVTTVLNGMARLSASKYNTPSSNVFPNQIIRYTAGIGGYESQVNEPVILDLLPAEVDYVGNIAAGYSDFFNDYAYYTLNTPNTPIPTPVVTTTPNYNGTGRTLLKISFPGFNIEQRSALYVEFDVRVKIGATGTITNTFILGNIGKSDVNPYDSTSNKVPDVNDLDGDGITDEILYQTNPVSNIINFSTSLASDKKVKAELDTQYTEEPLFGKTTQGGSVDYKLTVTNIGNVDLQSFEIVDILPHIGDTGVISSTPRLSSFPVYVTGQVSANIEPTLSGAPAPNFKIEYSLSDDPIRFDSSGTGTIGTGSWISTPPADLTLVKSFKITSINTILKPGQSIIIDVSCVAPVGVADNLIAWNSFALKGSYFDELNQLQYLLPVEPEKVGVTVESPTNKITIGDFVWEDLNKNGIQDPDEPGINGVVVNLYKQDGVTLVDTTTTAFDINNNAGYYLFTNKDPGCYVLEFISPNGYTFTIKNAGNDPTINSKVDPTTGVTDTVCVNTPGGKNLTIDAGVLRPAKIGDLVWVDYNQNGVQDPGEPGVPNATVTLYKCDGTPTGLSATTDSNGNYSITINEPGQYYVVFSNIPSNYVFSTVSGLVDANGRRPGCFTVKSGDNLKNIDAPIFPKPPVIYAENKCILTGDTFNPLTGVTAQDALGNDLTSEIIVTQNTVDTTTPGIYSVTYSVTDSWDQTVTKKILVKVCKKTARYQAITDIIESVALEQTAIANIIQAEGAKIQKANALKLSNSDLLSVNDSVADTLSSISTLELVLKSKLELFDCDACGNSCCKEFFENNK